MANLTKVSAHNLLGNDHVQAKKQALRAGNRTVALSSQIVADVAECVRSAGSRFVQLSVDVT